MRTLAGGEVGGYSLVNLTVRHTGLLPNLRVSASAYNLFDKDYGIVGSEVLSRVGLFTIAGDGRATRLKLEYTF